MIVLFTDFGPTGPYMGQVTGALMRDAPGVEIVQLMCDAPAFDPRASAYLLAAYGPDFPEGSVFLAVVDPGVGGPRAPLALQAGGRWYVGPDNGLLAMVARRAGPAARAWEITWRPARLSATFHGRDLFAPVAARLARGEAPPGRPRDDAEMAAAPGADWPDDLARVIYVDAFGNAVTGLRAAKLPRDATLAVAGRPLRRVRTFAEAPPGAAMCYENANGLMEIAVNQGSAARTLNLDVGAEIHIAGDST